MTRMKVVALAGGTGSAKLLRGLDSLPIDLTVVANVGDNFWTYGAYVCPDIDVACYTLAGIVDRTRGWGIAGDTFDEMDHLARLGVETWFSLGDRDLATCLFRTALMRSGASLTEATSRVRDSLGVRRPVIPLSDSPVETRVVTDGGDLHLQEYWVRERGLPPVSKVWYKGVRRARPTPEVKRALDSADRVVLCPANPVTSIGPMLATPGFESLLSRAGARVVALSPMEGKAPFSGPAGKLMKAAGQRQDSVGVAMMYSRFLDAIVISAKDPKMKAEIEELGVDCSTSKTRMRTGPDEVRVAKELVRA
jgi:LPPG:FO 2-phospho-L-lactate transferase